MPKECHTKTARRVHVHPYKIDLRIFFIDKPYYIKYNL